MFEDLILKTKKYIKGVFLNNCDGHDYYHSIRVCDMAKKIAISENANVNIVQLAALLHDVNDRKISNKENNETVKEFLIDCSVSDYVINEICEIINEIPFYGTDSVVPKTIEGKCVQDADRLDAIGAIGIARAFAFGGKNNRKMYLPESKPVLNMNKEIYIQNDSTTINHFYEKLFLIKDMMNTEMGKLIASERDKYMKKFIDEFFCEWNCEH